MSRFSGILSNKDQRLYDTTDFSGQEYIAAGCNDALIKPIQFDSLLEKLQEYLNLEWVYDDTGEGVPVPDNAQTPEPLIPPSREALMTLSRVMVMGDIMAIHQWVQDTQQREPACAAFSARIESLVQAMQLNELHDFVTRYLKDTS